MSDHQITQNLREEVEAFSPEMAVGQELYIPSHRQILIRAYIEMLLTKFALCRVNINTSNADTPLGFLPNQGLDSPSNKEMKALYLELKAHLEKRASEIMGVHS